MGWLMETHEVRKGAARRMSNGGFAASLRIPDGTVSREKHNGDVKSVD